MEVKNIVPHKHQINREDRSRRNQHKSVVIWFTGLSGSGKSTIADKVEQYLFDAKIHTYLLDGDNVRMGLNKGLSFSEEDRQENLRRIAEVAKLFVDAGIVVLSAFVSPLEKDRKMVKSIVEEQNFIEVFINTSLEECERRDVKGLYRKARAGEIKDFTGIDSPYEEPKNPDLIIKTEQYSIDEASKTVIEYLFKTLKIKL